MFLHFPCKEFAEESGKTGLRADTPFLPAYHFTQSAAVCQRRIALWVKKIFRAAPHNSARDSSERFCPKIKFGKRRNTGCISSFSNCKIGAKDPLLSADAIVRCCLRESCGSCRAGRGAPAGNTSLRPWQLTNTVGGHPVRWRVGDKAGGAAAPWLPLWGSWRAKRD